MTRLALACLLLSACAANTCPLAHDVGLECSANTWRVAGIPNLARVSWPGRADVYRSGQPEGADQWALLARIGVTDILKLNFTDEGGDDGAAAVGIRVHHVPIPPSTTRPLSVFEEPAPEARTAIDRLVVELTKPGHVLLVHCKNGHDRTGAVVMRVRVLVDGWEPLQAYEEARQWGYHHQVPGLDAARREWVRR